MKTLNPASPSRAFGEFGFWRPALASLAIGLIAPFVYFGAGEVVETPGQNPPIETIFPAIVGLLFMAFCSYWLSISVRPEAAKSGLLLIPAQLPLLLFGGAAVYQNHDALAFALASAWVVSAILGSVAGFRIGHWVGTRPLDLESASSGYRGRILPAVGAGILAAVALLVAFAVIPALVVERSYASGFRAQGVAHFLGGAAAVSLLLSAILARAEKHDTGRSTQSVAVTAIGSLLLALFWALASGIRSQHPDLMLASRVLVACALGSLLTAGFLTAASVRRGSQINTHAS